MYAGIPRQSPTFPEIFFLECQTEVRNERLPRGIDQDVAGLDVPVNQTTGYAAW